MPDPLSPVPPDAGAAGSPCAGSAVLLVPGEHTSAVALTPAALGLLRTAGRVLAEELPPGAGPEASLVTELGAELVPDDPGPGWLAALAAASRDTPVVLLSRSGRGPAAQALVDAGAWLVAPPAGAALLDGVAVMDRLRSPGGCLWDAEQTHRSLCRYLVEETYEVLEAVEHGDPAALREELGDVLLQVLFHARIAAEDGDRPFGIDEVVTDLVTKLVGRHPHVFAGDVVESVGELEHRWEQGKRAEKGRQSSVDGVPSGQPAAALAGKLVSRATRAGLPADLLPGVRTGPPGAGPAAGPDPGVELFEPVARAALTGADPESLLRAQALRFAAEVRSAEESARAAGQDPARLDPSAWRAHWPTHPGPAHPGPAHPGPA